MMFVVERQRRGCEAPGVTIGFAVDKCGGSEDCIAMLVYNEWRTGQEVTTVGLQWASSSDVQKWCVVMKVGMERSGC